MNPDVSKTETHRLSQIKTNWSAMFDAVERPDDSSKIQRELLLRYAGPAYRYLLAMVRDADIADNLAQEFAFRFIRGDFQHASPDRGRFRDYVKRSLVNLVKDHYRRQRQHPIPMGQDAFDGQ